MVTKIMLLIASSLIVIGSVGGLLFQDPDHGKGILDATIMITITVPELGEKKVVDEALPIPPDEYRDIARPASYVVAEGMGTLVSESGEFLLITHDHWSVLDSDLGKVQIRDAQGQVLTELDLLNFKRLIRHRDGGTMILTVNDQLAAKITVDKDQLPAYSSTKSNLSVGDVVGLVHRQRNGGEGVDLTRAVVEGIGEKDGKPTVRLVNTDDLSIVGGDSGGGVWLEGELVGNMWTTVMIEDIQSGDRRSTNISVAALISGASAG